MAIDWNATGSMLTGIGTIAGSIAIIVAARFGRNVASNFRIQKQSERELEYAERALAAAYSLEAALDAIRSPLSTANELKEAEEELASLDWFKVLDKREKDQAIQANVFFQRIRHFASDFDEAALLIPFIKAYFGGPAASAMETILHARHTVRVYADAYAKDNHIDPEHSKTIRNNIWRGFGEGDEDPVKSKIKRAIQDLETNLGPLVRSKIQPTSGNDD